MIFQTAFGDWEVNVDGTVTDLQNGLMWARSPLGSNGIGNGSIVEDTWEKMSSSYGAGVMAYDRSASGLGPIVRETIKISGYDRGYTSGRERIMHAGMSGWRLPTLDEVSKISFDEGWGAKKIKSGESDPTLIFEKLFQESCIKQSFWVANKCWDPKEIRTLFGLSAKKSPVAWSFIVDRVITIIEGGGEEKAEKKAVLLIRNVA